MEIDMRLIARFAVLGALIIAPASAMAFVWPFARPAIPEQDARMIATQNGVAQITDIDGTLDADWHIEGVDAWGHEVEMVIDGSTGAIERAEMESN